MLVNFRSARLNEQGAWSCVARACVPHFGRANGFVPTWAARTGSFPLRPRERVCSHLGRVVFEPGRVAKDYVKSWFIVDLLSVIPFDRVSTPEYSAHVVAPGCWPRHRHI